MKGIVLVVLVMVVGLISTTRINCEMVDVSKTFDYVYENCIKEGKDESICYELFIEAWKEHLDKLILEYKTKLEENNYNEESKLFAIYQENWQNYYESLKNFYQVLTLNISNDEIDKEEIKKRIISFLSYRCFEIEKCISSLDYAIERDKKKDKD